MLNGNKMYWLIKHKFKFAAKTIATVGPIVM